MKINNLLLFLRILLFLMKTNYTTVRIQTSLCLNQSDNEATF